MTDEKQNIQVETPQKRDYVQELLQLFNDNLTETQLKNALEDYHENDIAQVLPLLTIEQRKRLYKSLNEQLLGEIFAYTDDVEEYLLELSNDKVADIIESMDSDDALDVLEELDEDKKHEIIELLDKEAVEDIKLIIKYEDDEIGSQMTTNYIKIDKNLTVKQAMTSVISQASENDNISTIYVTQNDDIFYGAIYLRDLVIARSFTPLEDLIVTSYPYLYAKDKTEQTLDKIKEYAEDSLPVLNADNQLIGALTSSDVIQAVDEQLGEDYAKFAGLTEEEETFEPLKQSVKKRIPWLITLLILDIFIGTYIGVFEAVVVGLPFLVIFQSLILGMSGNVGTQSLAVSVRFLNEEVDGEKNKKLIGKEVLIGFLNGLILGIIALICVSLYSYLFGGNASGKCLIIGLSVGLSLMISMTVSAFTGSAIPVIIEKFGIDPASASGPLITTVNDLVAVTVYYSLAILLIM